MKQTKKKIGQVEFIQNVAKRSGLSKSDVRKVYDAILDEIVDNTANDVRITFPNFGAFYAIKHKGHHVQYGDVAISDYMNLKFSATRKVNQILQDRQSETASCDEGS